MEQFRGVLEEICLFNLGCKGDRYTRSNKHSDNTFTKERLERAIANAHRFSAFKEAWVEGLIARCSDHKPILLSMFVIPNKTRKT